MIESTSTSDVAEAAAKLNQLFTECLHPDGRPHMPEIARRMGWTLGELQDFKASYGSLLNYDQELWASAPPGISPVTELELNVSPESMAARLTDEEMGQAVERADSQLARGLKSLGLAGEEVKTAEALQQFNRAHFVESMDMVSSGVLVTSIKLQTQQREIEQRLNDVRAAITSYGGIPSEERDQWVKEERLLMLQYVDIGDLLNRIQDSWYRGAASLAIIKMRARDGTGPMKKARPSFSARDRNHEQRPD